MNDEKLIMTLLVRDEADIVRHNIEFHLRKGVDFIIATDNGSIDGTRDILREYEEKGVLHLIDEDRHDHSQAQWVNRMGTMAREEFGADIVFHCDADEFWLPRSGNLKSEISRRVEDILNIDVIHVLLNDKDGNERFPEDTRYAVVNPIEPDDYMEDTINNNFYLYKNPPKVIFRTSRKNFEVSTGNHFVINTDWNILSGKSYDIVIYHFPIRNKLQFFSKVINAGCSLERNSTLDASLGFHVRRWYKKYKNGLLDKVYDSLVIKDYEVEYFINKGFIEYFDFNSILYNSTISIDNWICYNCNLEQNSIIYFADTERRGSAMFLYDLVRNLKPKLIVELGAEQIDSIFPFCQAVKDGSLDTKWYLVDPCLNEKDAEAREGSYWEDLDSVKDSFDRSFHVSLLPNEFDCAINYFMDGTINILKVNGCGTFRSLRRDYKKWFSKVQPGGCIIFRDIPISHDGFTLDKSWDNMKMEYRSLELWQSHDLVLFFKEPVIYHQLINSQSILGAYYPKIYYRIHNNNTNQTIGSISALKARFNDQADEMAQKEEQLQIAYAQIAEIRGHLNILHNSISWRVTAPLRGFRQRFPRLSSWARDFITGTRSSPDANQEELEGITADDMEAPSVRKSTSSRRPGGKDEMASVRKRII
jgi:hypothetical protein